MSGCCYQSFSITRGRPTQESPSQADCSDADSQSIEEKFCLSCQYSSYSSLSVLQQSSLRVMKMVSSLAKGIKNIQALFGGSFFIITLVLGVSKSYFDKNQTSLLWKRQKNHIQILTPRTIYNLNSTLDKYISW